jgi:hypothetical protein
MSRPTGFHRRPLAGRGRTPARRFELPRAALERNNAVHEMRARLIVGSAVRSLSEHFRGRRAF